MLIGVSSYKNRNENNPAWVLFINPGTKYIALSRPVCAGGKTAIRRCSHSTASIDNAAHRRRQGGLSYSINWSGASNRTCIGVAAFDKGLPLTASRALIHVLFEALRTTYLAPGLINTRHTITMRTLP